MAITLALLTVRDLFATLQRDHVHDQITGVVTIMRNCKNMGEFRTHFAQLPADPLK